MSKYFQSIKKGYKFKNYANYVIILTLLGIFSLIMFTGSVKLSMASLFTQIGFSIILAVSLNVVVGFLGELSLGHAGFMCIGAYIGGFAAVGLSSVIDSKLLVLIIAMLIGGIVSTIFGFIIGLPSLRLKGDYLAIVTLAFGEIVRNIFKNQKLFGAAMGLNTSAVKYDTRTSPTLFVVTFVVALIMLIVVQNFIRSKHGRAVTAIRDNEIAAKAMGINVTFYKLFAFMLSSFFAGIAGVIYAHYATPVNYSFFSYNYSIEILVMVVLGGMGNITGSIVAATAISLINYSLQKYLSGNLAAMKYLIYALILIIMVIFSNAPALADFRRRFRDFFAHILKLGKKHDPANINSDEASWDRIPTKIRMDELLSTDINVGDNKPQSKKGE